MPNILLTNKCVRSCPYCFASKYMEDANGFLKEDILSWDGLVHIVNLLLASGNRTISLQNA